MHVNIEAVYVDYHDEQDEWQAQAIVTGTAPGMIVGYSQDSKDEAIGNLRAFMKELNLTHDPGLPLIFS